MESVVFWLLSAIAVAAALSTVIRKNPIGSALSLVVCLVAIAGLFATLSAHFLFVIQLLVYAGAVMVLVIYVIMILNLQDREMRALGISKPRFVLALAAAIPVVIVLLRVAGGGGGKPAAPPPGDLGSIQSLAEGLFTRYLVPFEVLSVLLLAAMVGAVVLAMRKF